MNLTRRFEVERSRDEIVDRLCRDETLLGLLARGDTQSGVLFFPAVEVVVGNGRPFGV